MKDAQKVGRKPILSGSGERLGRINIKLFPSQIAWLNAQDDSASATIRALIDKHRAGRMLRGAR